MIREIFATTLLAFCASVPCAGAEGSAGAASMLYSRTTNFFNEVALFKPAETQPPSAFFQFAPLILQELKPNQATTSSADRFGTLFVSNGVVCVDAARPALYAQVDNVELTEGSSHPRYTYLWCYGANPARLQGIRVVLDTQGRPAIWQVLADTSGTQLLFVSESLEAAAAARYSKALEGRRFVIERSVAEAPNVIVARVLDESSVPMGPIVYALAKGHDISTVICRCMPAQARRVGEARTYDLLPFEAHASLLLQLPDEAKNRVNFWPGASNHSPNLRDLLRLP